MMAMSTTIILDSMQDSSEPVADRGSMETNTGTSADTEVLKPAFPPIKKEKLADGTEVLPL
jgi:hypothetical protein